eukprot:TRINITY_DN103610_c0_g1_i1.p1 TRINITY_DN103610_c0_g1~~TRINITY_DN103610_c0_g1_i1.p1  ORF type:complete len:250 (+),score=51.31 TRINITY_DN103610_c0_g1_i1:88-750(+)
MALAEGALVMHGVPDSLRSWWSRIAPAELDRVTEDSGRSAVLEHVARLLRPSKRVLDLGCGSGLLARQADRPDILGVDMSPSMVAEASKHMDTALVENILEYFPSDCPDAVVLCNVLEPYSAEVRQLLFTHVLEFLAPGGQVIVVIGVGSSGLGSEAESALDLVFPTATPIKPDVVEEDLALAGFEVAMPELVSIKPPAKETSKSERRSFAVIVGRKSQL